MAHNPAMAGRLRVLEAFAVPRYHKPVGTPAETRRFWLRVSGPLPVSPSQDGEFVLVVRRYGARPGWWFSLERESQSPGPARSRLPFSLAEVR